MILILQLEVYQTVFTVCISTSLRCPLVTSKLDISKYDIRLQFKKVKINRKVAYRIFMFKYSL